MLSTPDRFAHQRRPSPIEIVLHQQFDLRVNARVHELAIELKCKFELNVIIPPHLRRSAGDIIFLRGGSLHVEQDPDALF
jgi:hypothetical protein